MDSESGVSPKMQLESGVLSSKMSSENVSSNKNMIFRADKIDLKRLDAMLEKHLSKLFSKSVAAERPKEAWEIDTAKLDIHYSVANGSYGTVYRGTYDGQDVAVKVLDWGEDGITPATKIASLRTSFWQEVSVWQKLDHPNVTKFLGASLAIPNLMIPSSTICPNSVPSKTGCVIAEFLTGGTLKQYLFRNRLNKLPYQIVIKLALDLARGLSYLHSKKIVHRDIKPDNMLLDANRNLKIADFGVARIEANNQSEMTSETGTYGYMAPEVLNGKPYNRKCDVYSFGICLSEIYSCTTFSNLTLTTVSCSLINKRLRPKIPKNCPSDFANIIRKCWNANPERRPEMHEVVTMLEAIDTRKGGTIIRKEKNPLSLCFFPSGRS